MGLTILSDDDECVLYDGGYMQFTSFRQNIAALYNLKLFKDLPSALMLYRMGNIQLLKDIDQELKTFGGDAIIDLLMHSDCEGILTNKQCSDIKKSLDKHPYLGDNKLFSKNLKAFNKGLIYCIKNNIGCNFS